MSFWNEVQSIEHPHGSHLKIYAHQRGRPITDPKKAQNAEGIQVMSRLPNGKVLSTGKIGNDITHAHIDDASGEVIGNPYYPERSLLGQHDTGMESVLAMHKAHPDYVEPHTEGVKYSEYSRPALSVDMNPTREWRMGPESSRSLSGSHPVNPMQASREADAARRREQSKQSKSAAAQAQQRAQSAGQAIAKGRRVRMQGRKTKVAPVAPAAKKLRSMGGPVGSKGITADAAHYLKIAGVSEARDVIQQVVRARRGSSLAECVYVFRALQESLDLVESALTGTLMEADEGEKTLHFMVGAPGSGKSYEVAKHKGAAVHSTDNFPGLYTPTEKGPPNIDFKKLPEAHGWNQEQARKSMEAGHKHVIIDNTNTAAWQMRPYLHDAAKHGYKVHITHVHAPIETIAKRQTHGVPEDRLAGMKKEADGFAEKLHGLKDHPNPMKVLDKEGAFKAPWEKENGDNSALHGLKYTIKSVETSGKSGK